MTYTDHCALASLVPEPYVSLGCSAAVAACPWNCSSFCQNDARCEFFTFVDLGNGTSLCQMWESYFPLQVERIATRGLTQRCGYRTPADVTKAFIQPGSILGCKLFDIQAVGTLLTPVLSN